MIQHLTSWYISEGCERCYFKQISGFQCLLQVYSQWLRHGQDLNVHQQMWMNKEDVIYKQTQYWSFSFSISPSYEYSGFISFRVDCFDLFEVPGTLKSLLQHHNSNAFILQHSVFFMVQLLNLYMNTGKIIALTIYRPLSAK